METQETYKHLKAANRRKVALGIAAIIFGSLWLLYNLDVFDVWWIRELFGWEMILIIIGGVGLAGNRGNSLGYTILVLIGGFFLLDDIYDFSFRFYEVFWPSLVILVGIVLVFRMSGKHYMKLKDVSSTDIIDTVSIFGGSDIKVDSQTFKGGKATAIFGGSEVDLTGAELADGIQVIEMVNIFGGNTVIVPSHWNVKVEVTGILGSFGDKRKKRLEQPIDTSKTLVIRGIAVLGGGEVKSI